MTLEEKMKKLLQQNALRRKTPMQKRLRQKARQERQQDNASHAEDVLPAETAAPEAQTAQAAVYTHVDVRL